MYVRVDREGPVAVVTLDRAPVNAFDVPSIADLDRVVHGLVADADTGALVLTGANGVFCGGADLGAMATTARADRPALFRELTKHHHEVVRTLRTCGKPVVSALPGAAAGGGFSLALAGDRRLGAPAAAFKPGYLTIGVPPDGGLSHLLPRAVGPSAAQRILLDDARVGADEARSIGLLHDVVPAESLREEAVAVAARLAAWPRDAFAATKGLLHATYDNPLTVQLAEERMLIQKAAAGEALDAALKRFASRR